jgi:ABC-type transport system involved in cytochrome c biogenesis permease subunit
LPGLVASVGPLAFISVFVASHGFEHAEILQEGVGTWPHAHVLLASGGIALLGIAGLAGLFFLVEHRRLKAKFAPPMRVQLPSLEALDRVNAATTAVGFVLLTLGILTGMIWLMETEDMFWTGSPHEAWMMIAWAIYAGLVAARYVGHQGARQAAASALAGFAFLFFGVMGVGLIG